MKSAGRFEKRFILDSLMRERVSLPLELGGRRLQSRLSAIGEDSFCLVAEGFPLQPIPAADYALEIAFRGMVFSSSGAIIEARLPGLRLSLDDPWALSSRSPAAPSRVNALSLSVGGRRLSLSLPVSRIASKAPMAAAAMGPSLPPDQERPALWGIARALAGELGSRLDFIPSGGPFGIERPLSNHLRGGARLAILGPPPVAMDSPIPGLTSFPFLSREDFGDDDPLSAEGCLPVPPGIYSALPSAAGGDFIRFLPAREAFAAVKAEDLSLSLLFGDLLSLSDSALASPLCLSLQPDHACLWFPDASSAPPIESGTEAYILLSFPGRELDLRFAGIAASRFSQGLAVLFEQGGMSPEDYRFLFERLHGKPIDAFFSAHGIKKAAS